jgi:DNA-binding PadR family transcriptional regulator
MSNSRSVWRGLKASRHVRSSGAGPARQPWNKELALTSTPSVSTTRRWLEACADEGLAERKGSEQTGRPGRPAVLYGLTAAGREREQRPGRLPPAVQWEQLRRQENARKKRGMQRAAQAARSENTARQKLAGAERRLQAATGAAEAANAALEEAKARLLTAEIVLLGAKTLIDSGGDPSVLLHEEAAVLRETGCVTEKDGRLFLVADQVEAITAALGSLSDRPSS